MALGVINEVELTLPKARMGVVIRSLLDNDLLQLMKQDFELVRKEEAVPLVAENILPAYDQQTLGLLSKLLKNKFGISHRGPFDYGLDAEFSPDELMVMFAQHVANIFLSCKFVSEHEDGMTIKVRIIWVVLRDCRKIRYAIVI